VFIPFFIDATQEETLIAFRVPTPVAATSAKHMSVNSAVGDASEALFLSIHSNFDCDHKLRLRQTMHITKDRSSAAKMRTAAAPRRRPQHLGHAPSHTFMHFGFPGPIIYRDREEIAGRELFAPKENKPTLVLACELIVRLRLVVITKVLAIFLGCLLRNLNGLGCRKARARWPSLRGRGHCP
jgi:hypothetical protein